MFSKTIIFKGSEIQIKFGTWALSQVLKHYGISVNDLEKTMSENPFEFIPLLIYFGACTASGKDLDAYDKGDFYDWVDEVGGVTGEEVGSLIKLFTSSINQDVPKKKIK